jgi:hypothetical protein
MTCFLCGGGITRSASAIEGKKTKKGWAFENAGERTIWVASVDATHTRAESAEGKGETMVGVKRSLHGQTKKIMGKKLQPSSELSNDSKYF